MISMDEIRMDNLDNLIKNNMAFIIKTVSDLTGRYVSIENDEEFSIALEAFAESISKYDAGRGSFLSFSKLVMESRLKTYLAKTNRKPDSVSLEVLGQQGVELVDSHTDGTNDDFMLEMKDYKQQLGYFGLNLELLADTAPKHQDTKDRAINIAETTSKDEFAVGLTYKNRRLPIRLVAKISNTTEKIVKVSKNFILGAMIIFVKHYPTLSSWIVKAEV